MRGIMIHGWELVEQGGATEVIVDTVTPGGEALVNIG